MKLQGATYNSSYDAFSFYSHEPHKHASAKPILQYHNLDKQQRRSSAIEKQQKADTIRSKAESSSLDIDHQLRTIITLREIGQRSASVNQLICCGIIADHASPEPLYRASPERRTQVTHSLTLWE